jgi:NAD dependent epimerase/dehydratase family
MNLPETICDVEQLEEMLSRPLPCVVEAMSRLDGDIVVLGVAGKMGPTLARMAKRASEEAGKKRKIIGVARFSNPAEEAKLRAWGIETIKADLLREDQLAALPVAPNMVYMAGMKFGATGNEGLTWAMNCYLPGMVAQRYRDSRIVAFSTGNVYGLTPVGKGGSKESDELNAVGDYAMSCVGRERIFDHFSRTLKIPMAIIRLYYATEMRYGVLVDLAGKVWRGEMIDVSMGHFNAIWQQDANAQSLAAFGNVTTPPFVLNVVGSELLNMRRIAEGFGEIMGKKVEIRGKESADALLGNAGVATKLFGRPSVSVEQMMKWIAGWVQAGGVNINKPTHFEERGGKF